MAPTLVFTTGADAFQYLINLTTFSPAAHAAIGLGDQLLHVHEKGVCLEPRINWFTQKRQRLIAEFAILPNVQHGVQHCLGRVGEAYDVAGVFKLGLMIILRRMLSPLQHVNSTSNRAHTCAAFVMLLDPMGLAIPEWRGLDRENVLPVDLLAAARDGSSFRRLSPSIREL